jgi:CubicO group peptidase (beta-lactamase class C family)
MRRDAIFRIASTTKPITAAAAMILVEECKLGLDEPVDRLLPELGQRRVLKRLDGPLDDTVPANRPITLRDLLTFRLGIGAVLAPPGRYPIQTPMEEAGLAPGVNPPSLTPDEWMKRLGGLPLVHQPGEGWLYHTGSDVLGVLIARASGETLESFGMGVCTRRDDLASTPGRFGWNGGTGTSAYTDPGEEMVGILMTQRLMDSPAPPAVFRDFWTSAYQAIDD